MKKLFFLTAALFFSISASAGIIPPGTSYTGTAGTYVDDGSELFRLTDTSNVLDDSQFFTRFDLDQGNNSGNHGFGIFLYNITDSAKVGGDLQVFNGQNLTGSFANVSWNLLAQQATSSFGTLDFSGLIGKEFGFGTWFSSDGFKSYSVSALNPNGNDYASYHWATSNSNDAFNLYAFHEDNDYGGILDRMVVGITDVRQVDVPEPASAALFGLGILGFMLRKKKNT